MKLPILISYAYWDKKIESFVKEHREKLHILIDSGAFTIHRKGGTIALAEYEKFLDSIEGLYDEAIQLDVLDDAKATAENYKKHKKKVIPVFTRGASLSELKDFPTRYCIGGLPSDTRNWWEYIDTILRAKKDGKAHILGFTNFKIFNAEVPPLSIDSSSWSIAFRVGQVNFKEGFSFKYADARKAIPQKIRKIFNELGLYPEEFRDRKVL